MYTASFTSPIQPPHELPTSPAASLTNRIAEKQRELSEMHELQVKALLLDVAAKDEELKKAKDAHQVLVNDFKFNLTLIAERDNELEKYEEVFKEVRSKLHQSELALSESKVNYASLEESMKLKLNHSEDKCVQLNKRIKDMKSETLALKFSHAEEVKRLQDSIDLLTRDMETSLAERDRMLEKERSEIILDYDTKMNKWEEENRIRKNQTHKELKEMQLKLADSNRQRDRALDDVARLETKLLETSSGQSELLGDTKKQLWEVEEKLRQATERHEEEKARHTREIQSEKNKQMIIEQKVVELQLQLKNAAVSNQHSKDAAKEAMAKLNAEVAEEVSTLRGELKDSSEKLTASIDHNVMLEKQIHSLETSLAEVERTKANLMSSFENQVRTLEVSHKESVQQLAKELNDRDNGLLALSSAKTQLEGQVTELGKQLVKLSTQLSETETTITSKDREVLQVKADLERLKRESEMVKEDYEKKLAAFRPYHPHSKHSISPQGRNKEESVGDDEESLGLGPAMSPPRLDERIGRSPLRPSQLAAPHSYKLEGFSFGDSQDISPPRIDSDNQLSEGWGGSEAGVDRRQGNDREDHSDLGGDEGEVHMQGLLDENARLRQAVSTMKQDTLEMKELMKSTYHADEKGSNMTQEKLEAIVSSYETKIKHLEERVDEAERERDKLMASSNALRGDLARLMSESIDHGLREASDDLGRVDDPSSMGDAVQTSELNNEASYPARYVESLEEASQDLVSRNTSLRREMRKLEKRLVSMNEEMQRLKGNNSNNYSGVLGKFNEASGVSCDEKSTDLFSESRVALVRFGLLKPAIYGLFEDAESSNQNDVDQSKLLQARLSFDDLVRRFSRDTQASQLLLGNQSSQLLHENIPGRASSVLMALGLRSVNTQHRDEGRFLYDVSAEELVCLWNVWSALGSHGVHAGITAFFAARSSFSAANSTNNAFPPPPPDVDHHEVASVKSSVDRGAPVNATPHSLPPQPMPTRRRSQPSMPRPAPRPQPVIQQQPSFQPRVVRNYNDMRP